MDCDLSADAHSAAVAICEIFAALVCCCRCGFDADASLATLSMLTSIEVRLEEALAAVAAIPQEQVGHGCKLWRGSPCDLN
jgi:hypothetical protein